MAALSAGESGRADSAHTKIAVVPAVARAAVIVELLKGIVQLRVLRSVPANEALALAFFRERSAKGQFSDFVDSTVSWYLSALDHSLILEGLGKSEGSLHVLDLGSGRGGFLRWLMTSAALATVVTRYTGLDQDPIAVARCREAFQGNAEFLEADLRELGDLPVRAADLIAVINVLPYVDDAVHLLAAAAKIARGPDSVLLLLEPAPGPYWERSFGGFGIHLRSEATLRGYLERSGWTVRELIPLALVQVRRRPVVVISRLFVCTRATVQPATVAQRSRSTCHP